METEQTWPQVERRRNNGAVARGGLQVIAAQPLKPGTKATRIKARHLSRSMVKIVVRDFRARQSEDDAACELRDGGIPVTGRVVLSAALLYALERLEYLEERMNGRLAA